MADLIISSPKNVRRNSLDSEQRKAVLQGLSTIQKKIAEIHQVANLNELWDLEDTYRGLLSQAVQLHTLGSEGCVQDFGASSKFAEVMNKLIVDISVRCADINGRLPQNERNNRILQQNLETLIRVLKANIRTEGLFRISGSASVINITNLSQKLKGVNTCDEHTAAGMLKKLLKEMPVRLLEPVQELLLSIDPSKVGVDPSESQKLKRILAELSPQNIEMLKILLSFLSDVAAEKKHNKMTVENLAICIAPNLVKQASTLADLADTPRYNAIVAALIGFQDQL